MRCLVYRFFFFFNDTATTEIYTLSLHDALPICRARVAVGAAAQQPGAEPEASHVRGDDRRHRLDRGPEPLVQQAHPEELVDEARGARQEKQESEGARCARTHATRASPARDPPPAAG